MTRQTNTPEDQPAIRCRPDGSIDTAYYMARGRVARAEAARDLVAGPKPAPARRKDAHTWGWWLPRHARA